MIESEEIYTTDMLNLETEKSAAEKRNQQGQGLKILRPNQMLSKLPITLAHLKAGTNSEKCKNEIRHNYCIHCTYRKNLQDHSIIIWSMIFKNGNNLYEHWKQ